MQNSITLYFDDVGLGMDINRGYQYKDNIESNRISVSNTSIYTDDHDSATYNNINVNNYVVQNFKNK
jgi:hypothetical protein